MALQIEPFANNVVLGDLRKRIEKEREQTAELRGEFRQWVNLQLLLEDHFKKNMSIPWLLKEWYPHESKTAFEICRNLSPSLTSMFQDSICYVMAKTETGQDYFTKKAYERALQIVETAQAIYDETDRKTHPERLVQKIDNVHSILKGHINAQINAIERRTADSRPSYDIDYVPV